MLTGRQMADEATKHYQWVAAVIRQFGAPNRQVRPRRTP